MLLNIIYIIIFFLFKNIVCSNLEILNFSPIYLLAYVNNTIIITINNIPISYLFCNINNNIIKANYISEFKYSCEIPYLSIGKYNITFSNNSIDYITSINSNYYYIYIVKNQKINYLNPKIISVYYTGYINIYGENFLNETIQCEWKRLKGKGIYNIITKGEYVNDNIIKCLTINYQNFPIYDTYEQYNYENIYEIKIGYLNNILYPFDISFTNEHLIIYIYQYPPNGYYIDYNNNGTIAECPIGYICNRDFTTYKNLNKFSCNFGYYMPFSGRLTCIPCPNNGYNCKEKKNPLTIPNLIDIDDGFYYINQSSYKIECPSGFICKNKYYTSILISPKNTLLSLIDINNTYFDILKCPLGKFCINSVYTEKTIESQYNTPQNCIIGHICINGSTNPLGIGECISGHYCPYKFSGPIPCPARTYCPKRGNIKPILCPEGYFNDKIGASKCQICPIGYICPYKGMFKPEPCPNGYYCEKKGLKIPYQFCRPGNVCNLGMKFNFEKKICFYSRICEITEGYFYNGNLTDNSYIQNVLEYDSTFHTFLCCYYNITWKNFLNYLDENNFKIQGLDNFQNDFLTDNVYNYNNLFENIELKYNFSKYFYYFNKNLISGYTIANEYSMNKLIETTNTEIYIPNSLKTLNILIPYHKNIINLIVDSMLSSNYFFTAYPCPRKYFCLDGTATPSSEYSDIWNYTPKLCIEGYYCSGGAKYFVGSGECEAGFLCPAGSEKPQIGSSTNSSSLISSECYPGTFITSETTSNICLNCPDGYESTNKGTYWPSICKEGFFRTIYESCISCPKGTFSFWKGMKDSSQCIPCPQGTLCQISGLNDYNNIRACSEGKVCDYGTGLISALDCKAGYYCPINTTPDNQYKYKCPEGFMCDSATGETGMYSNRCPENFYCPYGSPSNEHNDSVELLKCPIGTSSENSQGLISILQCYASYNYQLFENSYINDISTNNTNRMLYKEFNRNSFNYSKNIFFDKKLFLRFLEDNNSSSIDSDKLNETDPSCLIYDYYKELLSNDIVQLELAKYSISESISSTINKNRTKILTFSPFITNYGMTPEKIENKYYLNISRYLIFQKYYYKLKANSYAVITFDFRHLINNTNNQHFFIYGIDWDISFEKYPNLNSINYTLLQVPETFLNNTNEKSIVHEFTLHTLEEIIISININIYNGIYATFFTFFNKTASIIEITPQRAELNTSKFFGVILQKEQVDEIALPINLPPINVSLESQFSNINEKVVFNYLSYSAYGKDELTIHNSIEEGYNSYKVNSLYWGEDEQIGITYIPYISNCKGYGKYISLWGILEQHSNCSLVSEEDTIYIKDFSFGGNAKGDNCYIELDCIYDEEISSASNKNRWFEKDNTGILFSLTKNPIELHQLLNLKKIDNELINVIVTSNLENDEVPGTVQLDINYFQYSKKNKKLIDSEIIFSNPIQKKDIEFNTTVKYKFIINFQPYSHTRLMIKFALSSKFYLFIYVFEGFITTTFVVIFYFYHYFMSRDKIKPKFKYFTFLPMMVPPAFIGFLVGSIPIFLEIIFLNLIMTGKYIFTQVITFYSSNGTEYHSLFDYFAYLKGHDDIRVLRRGRMGTCYLFLGLYYVYYHSNLVVPKVPLKKKRSYDFNRWDFINWKKINVYFVGFLITAINVYYTMLSFSRIWSLHIWYFIYSYKVIGIIVENYYESVLDEQLLISGFACMWNVVQNLITFGAEDLIDFLSSNFIEQGGALIEKTYIEELTNYCRDMFPLWKEKVKKFLRRLFKYDLEIEDEKKNFKNDSDEEEYILEENEEEEEEEEEKKEETNKKKEDEKKDEKDDKKITKDFIKNDEINDYETLKKTKSLKSNNSKNEKNKIEEEKKNNDTTNIYDTNEDDNKNIEIIEKYFDRYKGFASDLLSYFYSIPFYFTLWMNYSETHIYENYDVTMENFIYFYYFSFISIFFTISNDIILYNLLHVYSHINLHDFLDYMRYRYYVRPKNWCLDDTSNNPELEFQSRKMFKLCFSSQYYFLKTCYMNSLMYTLIGIISLMLNNINPFVDQATPFIFVLVFITSKLTHFVTFLIFKKFKFWVVEEEEDVKSNEEEETLEEKPKKEIVIKPIAFSRESWEKIRNLKRQNNILKENLKTERFLLEATKKQFVNNNRKYLQNHIGNIITEKLLIKYKEKIISVLKKIFKDKIKSDFCENKLNIEEIKFYSPHKQKDSEENSSSNYSNEFRTEYVANFKEKEFFYKILSIWKKRAQLNIYLKNQIKLIIFDLKREKCDKCGKKINLKSFFYGDIINVFFNYINEAKIDLKNFDILNFKLYIKNNSKNYIKTLCLDCS